MKLEAGKYYRTRDGRKVGPMVLGRIERFPEYADCGVNTGVAIAYEAIRALTPPTDLTQGVE
jgi:hypothetical protein